MPRPKVFEKPSGVKDYLPSSVRKLRRMEMKVLDCMSRWGYKQIMTPTLEYYDTVGQASSTSNEKLFKLLDNHGTTLVLRSDMTAPIARVVSSLLRDHPLPVRLSYHSNVFRAMEQEAGREAEFFQTGVELVGDDSAEADAEVVALSIACLKAAGVSKFKVAIGHIGFLNGLFQETLAGRPDDQMVLKECLLNRDLVGYRYHVQQLHLPAELEQRMLGFLKLRGGQEICGEATALTQDVSAHAAISHICKIWDALGAYNVREQVLIDLTMIGNFSYYTGMTFEGYSADLGFPVCSGGRYDNLLSQFGRPAPATGFALKTNHILQVLSDELQDEPYQVLVLYDEQHRSEAIRYALELRERDHYSVETRVVDQAGGFQGDKGAYTYQGQTYQEIKQFVTGQKG